MWAARLIGGWWVLGLGACPASGDPCAQLSGEAKANCEFDRVNSKVEAGDLTGAEALVAAMADPMARDLVRLRLAIRSPELAERWCAPVDTEPAAGQCEKILGRPHLRSGP